MLSDKRGFWSAAFLVAWLMALASPVLAAAAALACGPDAVHGVTVPRAVQGEGTVSLSEQGTVDLVIVPAGRGADIELYRVAFKPAATLPPSHAFPGREDSRPVRVVEQRATFYRQLDVFLDGAAEPALTVFIDPLGCPEAGAPLYRDFGPPAYPASAIWHSQLPSASRVRSRAANDALAQPLLIPAAEAPGSPGRSRCQSGGPGAWACGIEPLSVGLLGGGACSIACAASQYACCGQPMGRAACACIGQDSDAVLPAAR